jgi:tetraacyldisaccharide 4'-kinase
MVQNVIIKILLAPLSLLYGMGVSLRDFFYRKGILKGVSFNIPVIAVGNLSIGGTGKTPHIEYLIRLLDPYLHLGTLSRGYGRKSRGYIEVRPDFSADQIGDEPLQFARKFPEVVVTVGEDRTYAIPKMLQQHPDIQVVLLDDAFQHLSVRPGLNILLTEYARPFMRDYLLPSGRLREWRSAYRRADMVIATKSPDNLSEQQRDEFMNQLRPLLHQRVFFSGYEYLPPYNIFDPQERLLLTPDLDVLVICAIAGTDYLLQYLETQFSSVQVMEFEDHHYFSNYDVSRLQTVFGELPSGKKIILTTEKDATRLELHRPYLLEKKLPIYVLPVQVKFLFGESQKFDALVKQFLLDFKV